jgi:protein gp37
LRDQCDGVVPFFFKQWGSWDHENLVHISKKVAGRILDGRTWDQFPVG